MSAQPVLSRKATVDVTQMIRKKLEREPDMMSLTRVEAKIVKNHLMKAKITLPSANASFTIFADEPASAGGEGSAPYMFGYFMAGALLCELAQYTWNAAALDLQDKITNIEMVLEGSFPMAPLFGLNDAKGAATIDQMRVITRIEADAPPEQIAKLAELAAERCPAHQSLINRVPYFNVVELNGVTIAEFGGD